MEKESKQIAQVIDLNKCIGCQTCTVSCKQLWTDEKGMEHMWWNIVNSMPGKGTPKDWETMGGGWKDGNLVYGKLPSKKDFGDAWNFNFNEVHYEGNKGKVQLKPIGERPEWGPNWDEEQGAGEFPNSYYFNFPRLCNHCTKPACLAACPTKAIYKREKDGVVLIDDTLCKGTKMCQMACPYKRIYFNDEKNIGQKCIACFPKIEMGLQPQCFANCIGKIRFAGWISQPEKAREDNPIDFLVHVKKVALPLFPQFGLEPNVYYIPPLNVPREFLLQMFGPNVDAALATYRNAPRDKDLAGLLTLFGSTELIVAKWKRAGEQILGYDENNREIIRVPLSEPTLIRQAFDAARGVARTNIS